MTDKDKTKDVDKAAFKKMEADLAIAKAFGELGDLEKAHHNKLDDEGKTAFLAKTAEERKTIMEDLAKADAVVYTSADGAKYLKSDDPRLVQMAKDRDEDRKVAKAATEKSDRAGLEKRAGELEHLPGDTEAKVQMLKAIDSIEDVEKRNAALSALKANNESLAKAFETVGIAKTGEAGSAEDGIMSIAKGLQSKDSKLSDVDAYTKALETEEGAKLYAKSVA